MGVLKDKERKIIDENGAEGGEGVLHLDNLFCEGEMPENVRLYAKATLEVGASVGYHTHIGESENYYILKGIGEYNDDGKILEVRAGDVTFTPSGHGHGIKNVGYEPLVFMALIVLE